MGCPTHGRGVSPPLPENHDRAVRQWGAGANRGALAPLLLCLLLLAGPAWAQALPPAGTWAAVPNSLAVTAMPPEATACVAPCVPPGQPELWSPWSLMGSWSGGDLAQRGGVWGFVLWGGGHGDGPDNSLYWLPFDGSGPARLSGPFLSPNWPADPLAYLDTSLRSTYRGTSRNQAATVAPDGAPKSRHTYSGLTVLRDRNLVVDVGGSITSGSGGGDQKCWAFDLGQSYAQAMALLGMGWRDCGYAPTGDGGVAMTSGYDEQGHVVLHRDASKWTRYDPATNTWQALGDAWGGSDFSLAVAVDTPGRKMWLMGPNLGEVMDLNTYSVTRFYYAPSDGSPPQIAPGYEWAKQFPSGAWTKAMAWSVTRQRLLFWLGGQNLLSVDPVGNTVATLPMTGATLPPPTPAGMFGRFRLIPGTDTVALVTAIDQLVYLGTLPPSTPAPPAQIPGVIRAIPMPARGLSPCYSGCKHVNADIEPTSGRVFFSGGDYTGTVAADTQSYRQETWSVDLASLVGGADPATAWRLEYSYCGKGGTTVQPKHPDLIGWNWDPVRGLFWLVPGIFEAISEPACAAQGETVPKVDDTNFLTYGVFSFEPATRTWARVTTDGGPDAVDAWQSVYDPASDALIRFGYNGGCGFAVDAFSLPSKTWSRLTCGQVNALGQDIRVQNPHLAFDVANRIIYAVDVFNGRLFRYHIATTVMEDLGPVPGGPFGTTDGTVFGPLSFDSAHQILLFIRNDTGQALAYHPDTATWEPLTITMDPPSAAFPFVRTLKYHPALDLHFMVGYNSGNLYVFRYAAGAPQAPASRGHLTAVGYP